MRNCLLFWIMMILALVIMASVFFEPVKANSYLDSSSSSSLLGGSYSSSCGNLCNGRCSKAGMKERCLKYCGICCRICKCVPSGTYGNKHQCPCYRDLKNSKGNPKCP